MLFVGSSGRQQTVPRGGSLSAQLPHYLFLDMAQGTLLLSTPRPFSRSLALGCAWAVEPRNVEVCDESVLLMMAKQHESMVRGLPIGSAIQGLMTILPDDTMPAWEKLRTDVQDDPIVQAKIAAIRAGLPHRDGQKHSRLRRIPTVLTLRVPVAALSGETIKLMELASDAPVHQGEAVQRMAATGLAQEAQEFEALRLGVEDALWAAGHTVERMDGRMLGAAVAQGLNPWMEEPPVLVDDIPLSEQVATEPMDTMGWGWLLPTRSPVLGAQVLSLHRSAKRTYPGMLSAPRAPEGSEPMALWDAWDGPLTLAVNIPITDQNKMKSELTYQRTMAFLQGKKLSGDSSGEHAAMKRELDQILEQKFLTGSPILWGRVHVVLWGQEAELRRGCREIIRTARQMDLEFCEEPDLGDTLFKQALPLGFDPEWPKKKVIQRERRLPSTNLVHLLPLYGAFRGTRTAMLSYLNQRGEAIGFDPFDSPTNPHILITGTSGAGKSYCVIDLLQQALALGAWAVILDRLPSYAELSAANDGEYIVLDFNEPICFNPFYGPLNDEHKAFLNACLAEMAGGGTEPIGRASLGILSDAVAFYVDEWLDRYPPREPGGMPREEPWMSRGFTDVFTRSDFLMQDSRGAEIGHDILRRLKMFYGRGAYAKFVDGRNTFRLEKHVTVIELSKLSNNSDLQGTLFFIIMHLLGQFYNDPQRRGQRKYFGCDEVAFLLKQKVTAEHLDTAMRTYRKLDTSVIFNSQQGSDYDSVVGAAIASIPDTKFILQQRGDELRKMQTLFKLTAAEMQMIRLAKKHQGWSSFYLKSGDSEGGIARLVPDRWTKWQSSQYPPESQMRQRYLVAAGGDMRQAVANLVRDYPQGLEGIEHA